MNTQKPATLGDLLHGQDPRLEISRLRGEISILKEELQRVKTTAEREPKELMHSRKMATIYDDPKGIDAILAEREKTHGSFAVHANCTQILEDTFYSFRDKHCFTAVMQEGLHMIFHKLGRIAAGSPHFQDHWDDIAGYATLVSRDISRRKTKGK